MSDVDTRQESERDLDLFFEIVPDLMCIASTDGFFKKLSGEWQATLGFTTEELLATPFAELIHPDDLAATLAEIEKELGGGTTVEFVNRYRCKDGSYRWLTWRSAQASNGLLFAAARDITERKLAEDELAEREEKYRQLFNNAEVGMFRTRLDGSEMLEMNDKFLEIFGRTRDEMEHQPSALQWADPHEREEMVRLLRAAGRVSDFECKMLNKQGELRNCLTSLRLYPEEEILEGSILDITERVRAEEAYREAQRLLSDAEAITGFGGWEYTVATGRITWTEEVYRLHGVGSDFDPSDPNRNMSFYSPEDGPVIERAFQRAVELGEPYDLEIQMIRADGQRIWIRTIARPVVEDGQVVSVAGNAGDVTDRKLAELAKEQYFRFFRLSADAMCIADPFGCFRQVNPAFLRMTGYSEEELTAKPFLDFVLEEDRARTAEEMELQVSLRESLAFENRYVCKDGRVILLSWNAYFDATDRVTYAIARDITEVRRAQEAKAQLAAVVESSNDGIITVGLDGSVLTWNAGAEQLYGWTAAEAVGSLMRDLVSTPDELMEAQGELLRKAYAGEVVSSQETVRTRRDGRRLDISFTAFPIRDETGAVVALGRIHRDISDQKRADAALRESEERMRLFFERQLEGMAITSPDKGWLRVNQQLCEMVGYSSDELAQMTWADLTHPEDLDASLGPFDRVMRGEIDDYSLEKRFVRKDGSVVSTNLSVACVRADDGTVKYTLALIEDLTERKLAEERLRETEQRYRLMFEHHGAIMLVVDPKSGAIRDANRAAEAFYGYTADELRSMSIDDINTLPTEEVEAERTRALREERNLFVFPHRLADGSVRNVEVHSSPVQLGDELVLYSMIQDVTAREEAEAALRQSEGSLRLLFDNMAEGFSLHEVVTDDAGEVVDFRFLAANAAHEQLTGLKHDETIGKTMLEVAPGADRGQIARYGKVAMTGEPYSFQYYSRTFAKYLRVNAFSPRRGLFGTLFEDVTEQVVAEEEQRANRAMLQAVVDGTTDIVVVKDLLGRYIMANKAALEGVGKPANEFLGRDVTAFFPAAEAEVVLEGDRKIMEAGSTRTYEERLTGADGQLRTYLATKGPVRDPGGEVIGIFGISRDITERKKLDAAMLQTEKLESLGELAGGLAHDFNNLLTVILGNCALAAFGMSESSARLEAVREIEKAARRGAELARLLLDASGREALARRPVDLNALAKGTVGLLMPSFVAPITVDYKLASDLPLVTVDEPQIQRVLSSLIVNASEALGLVGGQITLTSGVLDLDGGSTQAAVQGLGAGSYVFLDVVDDGPGITPDMLAKVFDPFFTTKFFGRGLGLSAAQGIVRAHGGGLTVRSVLGEGTEFRVLLPVTPADDPTA